MTIQPQIFKDYDIRAIIPEELDGPGAKRIGQVLSHLYKPNNVAIGHDMRLSADEIVGNLTKGFLESGVDVIDLGLITTDMAYYAAGKHQFDLNISVSASHNPSNYNGFKIVKKGPVSISGDTGIYDIRDLSVGKKEFAPAKKPGKLTKLDLTQEWLSHSLTFIDKSKIKPLKVVVDAGNGMGGYIFPKLQKHLPQLEIIPLYFELDGSFPNHDPSPIEAKNMVDAQKKVKETGADLGMAIDGDGDRVFLVDEKTSLISGTIMTAMVAESILKKHPGETILYNAICGRIVPKTIKQLGGKSKRVRVGHTLIKEQMVKTNAIFAGEHSGHYFFRDNYKADSGLIVALMVLELFSKANKPVSNIVKKYDKYPSSGEINFEVEDKQGAMESVENKYKLTANRIDWLDGVSIWFDDWWANVRPSNTQPLLRLNIEADNQQILDSRICEFVSHIESLGGKKEA